MDLQSDLDVFVRMAIFFGDRADLFSALFCPGFDPNVRLRIPDRGIGVQRRPPEILSDRNSFCLIRFLRSAVPPRFDPVPMPFPVLVNDVKRGCRAGDVRFFRNGGLKNLDR